MCIMITEMVGHRDALIVQLGDSFSPGLGIYVASIVFPAGTIRDAGRRDCSCQ